ncbi:MAG: invasion associated locus B family protein [Rhodospirillaceae bacterium]
MLRSFTLTAGLSLAAIISTAVAAEPAGAPLDLDTGGSAACDATRCIMSRLTSTGSRSGDVKIDAVFDRTRMQPLILGFEIPAGADQKAGVTYGFADVDGKTVRGSWARTFTAPIESCDKDTCRARTEDDITLEGHNLQKDFLDNLQHYGAFVVSFRSGGKDVMAAVSSRLLVGDRENMVAENKKAERGQGAGRRQTAGWDVQCHDDICTMSHLMSAKYQGKSNTVAAALQFDRATGKPRFLIVAAPPGADRDAGAEVAFFDPPDAPGRRESVLVTLPFAKCDATSCIARVGSDTTQADRDLQLRIVDNALRYPWMGVGYHAAGERVAALEQTDQFKTDYQTLLAELKKPQ